MEQWQGYQDPASGSRRYNGNQVTPSREYGQPQQQQQQQQQGGQVQPPVNFKYDQYQGSMNSHPHSSQNSTNSPINTTPQIRDGNGDVPMQDAHDPYSGGTKYPLRPHHQTHMSGGGRSNLHSPSEPSAAAQRYSPMELMSPTSPYGSKTQAQGQFSTPHSQRQSPSRGEYASHSPYYRQSSQLPPITPYSNATENYPSSTVTTLDGAYSSDSKSPRRPYQPANSSAEKRPVPQFKKTANVADLRPKVNPQPPFRRANPEGGFISVCYRVLKSCGRHRTCLTVIRATAPASPHRPSTGYVPYMQSEFQVRIIAKSSPGLDQTQQRDKERWLR